MVTLGMTSNFGFRPLNMEALGLVHKREGQDIDLRCSRLFECAGAGLKRRARSAHIIDKHEGLSNDERPALLRHDESASHVALAFLLVEPGLRPGRSPAPEELGTE